MNIDPYILTFSAIMVIATVAMGFWSAKKSKTASDFFVAGRSVSVGWNASAISGEYLSAASFMGIAGMVMSSGYDALWYPVCYACGYLFLLLFIAGPLRRFGAYTIPDFAEGRFDSPLFRKIAVCFVLFIGFFYTMPQMKGAGVALAYIFPGLPYWAGVALVGVIITFNVALGGMKGITLVQAFQYWAKMFAISVPIFILMSIYGHYGQQLELNGGATAVTTIDTRGFDPEKLAVPGGGIGRGSDTGRAQLVKTTAGPTTYSGGRSARWKSQAANFGLIGASFPIFSSGPYPLPLVLNEYMQYRPSLSNGYVLYVEKQVHDPSMFNQVMIDPTNLPQPNTRRASRFRAYIKELLATNGLTLFDLNRDTAVLIKTDHLDRFGLIKKDATQSGTNARFPLPEKAPKDDTWISPFGPLTTKAAKTANSTPRWNLTPENRAGLVDQYGRKTPTGVRKVLQGIGNWIDGLTSNKTKQPRQSEFAQWTNMPPNTSMNVQIPSLLAIRDLGVLLEKPVLLPTNLNRAPIAFEGAFHSRDEFVRYLQTTLETNGVRLDINKNIRAVASVDWNRYQTDPNSVTFVDDKLFSMFWTNLAPEGVLIGYSDLVGKKLYKAPDLPKTPSDFNQPYQLLLHHEAVAGIEKELAGIGITIIPAGDSEIWAVPTKRIAEYQALPVNVRLLSLLYTYSLIIALVCGTAGLPHILVRFYTNPDGVAAKRTTMWVMILIGVFYLFPPVFGALGRNLMPDLYNGLAGVKGTDGIVLKLPKLLNDKWPPLGSILSGITCAGAFAAFMSTFSGLLVSMTGALAHDIYGRILKPKSTPQERMRMFKLCAIICGTGAVLLGLLVETFEINKMVGWAFAIAATSYFPLLFLSTWWRGITMKGAATGMLCGGLLSVSTVVSTMLADQATWAKPLSQFYAVHPLLRILAEQPAIWALPLAISLMIIVSKLTARTIPKDIRMKMLVLHAPEKLGLKNEYIAEAEVGH